MRIYSNQLEMSTCMCCSYVVFSILHMKLRLKFVHYEDIFENSENLFKVTPVNSNLIQGAGAFK